jgi:transposase
VPQAAARTPFGPRLHAVATYLKTFQALSYGRLQAVMADLFGLTLSQGGLMNGLAPGAGPLPSRSRGGRLDAPSCHGGRVG